SRARHCHLRVDRDRGPGKEITGRRPYTCSPLWLARSRDTCHERRAAQLLSRGRTMSADVFDLLARHALDMPGEITPLTLTGGKDALATTPELQSWGEDRSWSQIYSQTSSRQTGPETFDSETNGLLSKLAPNSQMSSGHAVSQENAKAASVSRGK